MTADLKENRVSILSESKKPLLERAVIEDAYPHERLKSESTINGILVSPYHNFKANANFLTDS